MFKSYPATVESDPTPWYGVETCEGRADITRRKFPGTISPLRAKWDFNRPITSPSHRRDSVSSYVCVLFSLFCYPLQMGVRQRGAQLPIKPNNGPGVELFGHS